MLGLFTRLSALALLGMTQSLRKLDDARKGRQQAIQTCLADLQGVVAPACIDNRACCTNACTENPTM
nr:hypothetical protein [uncultured Agitococcus sp.]